MRTMVDGYTRELLIKHFLNYRQYFFTKYCINSQSSVRANSQGFPNDVSENLIKFIIHTVYRNTECVWGRNSVKTGDLMWDGKKIECKSFISNAPISFGHKQQWDLLYVLDARDWMKDKVSLYEIKTKNSDFVWSSTVRAKFPSPKTMIQWNKLRSKVPAKCIYSGSIFDILYNRRTHKIVGKPDIKVDLVKPNPKPKIE